MWLGVLLAILASTLLNVGKGVQKWKVAVLGHGRGALAPEHRRDALLWLTGVGMTTLASVGYSAALKLTDKPSTVSALGGLGLIGLVVFAHTVLKERIGRRELAGAALVVVGTAAMGALDVASGPQPDPSMRGLWVSMASIALIYGPLAVWSWRSRKLHGLIFGSLAGTLVGMAMVLGDVALVAAGGDLLGQMAGGWVYLALTVGTCALGLTQLGFWRSSAIVVVPTINSFMILAPLYLQYLVFDIVLEPMQYGAVLIIVAGVVLLTARADTPASQRRSETSGSPAIAPSDA